MAGRAAKSPHPIGRLLIATDFTAGATLALARAARLPLASKPRVTLLHVMPRLGPAVRLGQQAEGMRRLDSPPPVAPAPLSSTP